MEAHLQITMAAQKKQNIIQAVSSYGKNLFSFIKNRVSSTEDAEDILQEVWYQFTNVSATQTIEQVGSWLYAVARNKIIDKYRKPTSLPLQATIDDDRDEDEMYVKELLLATSDNPEMEQIKKVFWEQFFQALDELPPAQKEVFVLNELEEMTLQQIADRLDENIKTIISRKRYAVKHLRKRLESIYNEIINF